MKLVYSDDILRDNVDQIICLYVIHHGLSNNGTTEELRLMVAMVTRVKQAKYHPHIIIIILWLLLFVCIEYILS